MVRAIRRLGSESLVDNYCIVIHWRFPLDETSRLVIARQQHFIVNIGVAAQRDISARNRLSTTFHRKFLHCPLNETSWLVIARRHLFHRKFLRCPLDKTSRLVIARQQLFHRNTLAWSARRDVSAHNHSPTSFHRKFLRCPLNTTSRLVIARRRIFIVSFCIVRLTRHLGS